METLQTSRFRIGGMTCVNCRNRIERKLKSTAGVETAAVNYRTGAATVTWNPAAAAFSDIKTAIETLDYRVLDGADRGQPGSTPAAEIAGTLAAIIALYALLRGLGVSAVTAAFPLAETGMNGAMLFVIGLVTSVHCAAMCGGINLSQTLRGGEPPPLQTPAAFSAAPPAGDTPATPPSFPSAPLPPRLAALLPAILYNAGRVISYTAVGVIVGALGSAVSVSGRFQGAVQVIAGVFMVIMGLNMSGIFSGAAGTVLRRFNIRLPNIFAQKVEGAKTGGRGPLVIGLLNGLMPCGPLQAMQLYALSTGSPVAGGVSMFLFSAGTVPLMFGIGALGSLLSGARGRVFSRRVMKAGAVLVTVMGMTMFTYGWGLGGLPGPADAAAFFVKNTPGGAGAAWQPAIENGVQTVNSTLSAGRYPAITVRQGIPVRWTITAPQGSINGCNNRMIIREYGIEHRFVPGENVIEFTPEKAGRIPYSCWMGMIRSSITVVAEGPAADAADAAPDNAPVPAGVAIPTDSIALAEMAGEGPAAYQNITVNLRDGGLDPAIIVVRRGIPARWTVNNDSLDPGNSRLVFPAYYTRIDMKQGDNIIQLLPTADFDYSTADSVFYGFVKVVDDVSAADIEAIKTEAANVETLIYPEAYFEGSDGAGCCGR